MNEKLRDKAAMAIVRLQDAQAKLKEQEERIFMAMVNEDEEAIQKELAE